MNNSGFFVKVSDKDFHGPFPRLKHAFEDAKATGPGQQIYHGTIKVMPDGTVDTKDLTLISLRY